MNIKQQIIALNKFLSRVYESDDMRISDLLSAIGFDQNHIETIRENHIEQLAGAFMHIMEHRIFPENKRLFSLIAMRYGLNGNPPESLSKISEKFELSRERVFQLEQKALEKCRDDEYLEHFENTIKIAVSEILKSGSEASAVSSNNKKELDSPSDKMLDMTKYNKFSFEIVRLENGSQPVLVIRSLKPVKESGLILVTEDEIESFYACLVSKLESIGWKKRMKSKSIADIKQKYPRAYETWEIEEDEKLKNGFAKELSIEELSGILKRQPGAVKSRLEKIGLK